MSPSGYISLSTLLSFCCRCVFNLLSNNEMYERGVVKMRSLSISLWCFPFRIPSMCLEVRKQHHSRKEKPKLFTLCSVRGKKNRLEGKVYNLGEENGE